MTSTLIVRPDRSDVVDGRTSQRTAVIAAAVRWRVQLGAIEPATLTTTSASGWLAASHTCRLSRYGVPAVSAPGSPSDDDTTADGTRTSTSPLGVAFADDATGLNERGGGAAFDVAVAAEAATTTPSVAVAAHNTR